MKAESIYGIPKVKMNMNEFVTGDVLYGLPEELRYDYYTVTLPFESDRIVIDWQADSPTMLINVGPTKPTINDHHFELAHLGSDFVFSITREKILEHISDTTKLRGLTLTIGIYANVSDSLSVSPYAFKLYMPPILDIGEGSAIAANIIHIRSDQKVQCITSEKYSATGNYICLFAVIFDEFDIAGNMIVYPRSVDGTPLEIYGGFQDAELIEKNSFEDIYKILADISTEKNKINKKYIYFDFIPENSTYVFFVSSKSSESLVEVLSSTYIVHENMQFFPNPTTPQIYALRNNTIYLNFVTKKSLLINIVSVNGLGYFNWKENEGDDSTKCYLNGFNDRLSLSSFTSKQKGILEPLVGHSQTAQEISEEGFIFVVTYYPQTYIDQLKAERTVEFHYRSVALPLHYFVPISLSSSYTINFNFYNFGLENKVPLTYENNLFNIWAKVFTAKEIFDMKTDISLRPDSNDAIKGVLDLTFGTLFFSHEEVEKYYKNKGISDWSDLNLLPNLFFVIEKAPGINTDFSTLNLELNIYSSMESVRSAPISEGIYVSGKLNNSKDKTFIYALELDKNRKYFMIEYAGISDKIKFILTTNVESDTDDKFDDIKTEKKNGKTTVTIKFNDAYITENPFILLKVIGDKSISDKLDSYVFKYKLSDNEEDFGGFLPQDTKLTVTKKNDEYEIKFYPMPLGSASYYIKAFYEQGFVEGETMDSMALSQSPGINMQINNPVSSPDQQLSYTIKTANKVKFIKVLARFNFYDEKEFYLYNIHEINKDKDDDDNTKGSDNTKDSNNTALYVSIGVGLFVLAVIIVLVIFIFVYNKRNKNLIDQVNKISFVESGAKERGDDGNLLLDNNDL